MLKWLAVWVIMPILIIGAVTVTASFLRVPVPAEEHKFCLQSAQEAHRKIPNCPDQETILGRGARDPLAYYTLWLTLFTGALAVVGIGQGLLSSQQIKLAREEFIASHRPKIILREGVTGPPIYEKPLQIIFELVNTGETGGRIVRSVIEFQVINPNIDGELLHPPLNNRNDLGNLKFAPGQSHILRRNGPIWDPDEYQPQQHIADEDGAMRLITWNALHFVGLIVYVDDLGIERRTGFRREFIPSRRRFYRIDGEPDLDYAD